MAKALEYFHGVHDQSETNNDIDARLKSFKDAYREAFNGEEITPEQHTKLRASIANFIRSTDGSGL